ncbi:MAG: DUF2760 domain-containing protein [Planctomycetales bacterium]|nr:DUF2760 domain-containing protein [Planctomycetales bacterium]
MSLGIAFKAFFAALGNRDKAQQINLVLSGGHPRGIPEGKSSVSPEKVETAPAQAVPVKSPRDPAVTLLATLQREARLVDLIQEDLSQYSDAQVGAAARPCLQQCAGVLKRAMGLEPLLDAADGDSVEIPADASPTRFQRIGEGASASGKLVHHGWQATKIELPTWTGETADANIIAAAQVQTS